MRIGYVMASGRGETDRLLTALADRLTQRGVRLAGVVQTNTERENARGCDMDVRVLPGDRIIRISQSLGPEARGCCLDTSALENAVGIVEQALGPGCDLLLINKFGKHEAGGRGFRNAIAEALAADIPVIVGLNQTNTDAFHTFTGGIAQALPSELDRLVDWAMETGASAEA